MATSFQSSLTEVLGIFRRCLAPLVIPHEVRVAGCIRFLDWILTMCPSHVCREHEPRAGKPSLPFDSARTKIIKKAIAKACCINTLRKSCLHRIRSSFEKQTGRLTAAGFPSHLLVAVAETIMKKSRVGTMPAKRCTGKTKVGRYSLFIRVVSEPKKNTGQK